MTNEQRASAAIAALAASMVAKGDLRPGGVPFEGMHADDRADMVADLICDLGHACALLGVDYAKALDRAASNYAHESAPDYAGD